MHSNVRAQNVAFNENDSVLIDFDLEETVGVEYPEGYNNSFEERHEDASPDWERMKSHDIHSLLYLMGKLKCALDRY